MHIESSKYVFFKLFVPKEVLKRMKNVSLLLK